ncbi:MAG: hypothetical protein M1817_003073 [Caeruleum heppii]|nr:MAG: hypothetical protein M1817_003073 [Caeruleum heppii]
MPPRPRQLLFLVFAVAILGSITFLKIGFPSDRFPSWAPIPKADPPKPPELPKHPIYKEVKTETAPPIVDNFPRAAKAKSPADLPDIPSWNRPRKHPKEQTTLYIGFTRNWRLLQQTVVGYITSGWPPEDIYIVENTGTMDSNKHNRLSLQNPFYLDHRRLTEVFKVNVLTTPTLLTFAQLQNFYLSDAINNNRTYYFWGHMDVCALSQEDAEPFRSLYDGAVHHLQEALEPSFADDGRWGIRFFAYDRLALVNVAAFVEIGGWDTMIPFYKTDCDMHERLTMAGFKQDDPKIGLIYDLGTSLDDLEVLYRRRSAPDEEPSEPTETTPLDRRVPLSSSIPSSEEEDTLSSPRWHALVRELDVMQVDKNSHEGGRNFWQVRQQGGKGEPFYRDPEGFEKAILMTIDHGGNVFAEKWGHRDCDIRNAGLGPGDAWKVEHDWDRPPG